MDAEMNRMCYYGASYMLKTGWTDENPARRFWGCGNYGKWVKGCRFFCWCDPPVNVRSKITIGLRRRVAAMEKEKKKEFWEFWPLVLCFLWALFWKKPSLNCKKFAS
ncbi:hypothetical protein GQ457_05G017850 [Hibiscus cannabinus]